MLALPKGVTLSDEQRHLLDTLGHQSGSDHTPTIDAFNSLDYRRHPPTIAQFIDDDYYLGGSLRRWGTEKDSGPVARLA